MRLVAVDHADDAAELIADLIADRRPDSFGVATGSSPEATYRRLVERHALNASAQLYLVDEYIGLPPGSKMAYRAVIHAQLAEPLGGLRIVGPDVDSDDVDAAATDYECLLATLGGVDLQLLGVGRNGHIGFNEPGTPFSSRTRVAVLAPQTREDNARFFADPDGVPARCITQGLATILTAHEIIVIATGAAKSAAVAALLTQPPAVSLPASALLAHPRVTLVADRAARSAVPERVWSADGRDLVCDFPSVPFVLTSLEQP